MSRGASRLLDETNFSSENTQESDRFSVIVLEDSLDLIIYDNTRRQSM